MRAKENGASRRKMPNKQALWEYWKERRPQLGPTREDYNEFDLEHISCFACGDIRNIERCHIVPMMYGGSNDAQNIHLLCGRCHLESEGLREYWTWLRNKRRRHYKCYSEHLSDLLNMCGIDIYELSREILKQHDNDMSQEEQIRFDIMNSIFWKG